MAAVAQSSTALVARPLELSETVPQVGMLRAVLLPFVLSRLLFILVTLSASFWLRLLHMPDAPTPAHNSVFSGRWDRWDAVWYVRVATDGYRATAYANDHLNLAFFPLYPVLLHLWLQIWPWSTTVAAMLVANLSFLVAAFYLYRLVALDFGRAWAERTSWVLAFFPTSLFFFAGYSEGPFLLCIVLCLLRMREGHWWQAGLWGALATAARPLGVIVVMPLLINWYQTYSDQLSWLRHVRGPRSALRLWTRARLWTLGAIAIAPMGLLAFMTYLWVRFGNPLAFTASQRSWHRTWAWPWTTLEAAVVRPFQAVPHFSPDQFHGCVDTLWALGFLLLTLRAGRILPKTYSSFLWLFWAVTLCTPALLDGVSDPLISLPRFLLTAFPLCIVLAATPRRTWIVSIISLPLLALNTLIFVSGGWVA